MPDDGLVAPRFNPPPERTLFVGRRLGLRRHGRLPRLLLLQLLLADLLLHDLFRVALLAGHSEWPSLAGQ